MTRQHGTVELSVIHDDMVELIRSRGGPALGPESVIILASMLFVDEEGVATIREGSLRRWCRRPGRKESATAEFVEGQIQKLIVAGALAPGSTPTELRSMVARAAEADAGAGEGL